MVEPQPIPTREGFKDLSGLRFGWLVVLAYLGTVGGRTGKAHQLWLCRCDCGQQSKVRANNLLNGHTVSCGCLHKKIVAEGANTKHGCSRTPEWYIWESMKQRCANPKTKAYPNYGGRGIKVCERWLHSFENFLADMGPRPSPQHSIDRYPDNNGDYCPENCRWATRIEQGANTSTTMLITIRGETLSLGQWAERAGVDKRLIWERLERGWEASRAVFQPARPIRKWWK